MLMRSLGVCLWLQTAQSPDGDVLTKLFVLVVAALHAIWNSTFFWFCVVGAFVAWWVPWIIRDAVRDGVTNALLEQDFQDTIRRAVAEAIREVREEEQDDGDGEI